MTEPIDLASIRARAEAAAAPTQDGPAAPSEGDPIPEAASLAELIRARLAETWPDLDTNDPTALDQIAHQAASVVAPRLAEAQQSIGARDRLLAAATTERDRLAVRAEGLLVELNATADERNNWIDRCQEYAKREQRLGAHSRTLNTISFRNAQVLGRVAEGASSVDADPEELSEALIAALHGTEQKVRDYERAINFETTCTGCAATLEGMARIEAEREAMRPVIEVAIAMRGEYPKVLDEGYFTDKQREHAAAVDAYVAKRGADNG